MARNKFLYVLAALICIACSAAQEPAVPAEFLRSQSVLQGDLITFCHDASAVDSNFNVAVGQAIADELLVDARFHPMHGDYPIDGDSFFEDIFIALSNECDVALGLSMIPDAYPDWLTVTRPYATMTYVLAVTDPAYARFSDIPLTRPIGSHIASHGDFRLINYLNKLPANARWRRIPYGTNRLLTERLLDKTLSAIIIYEPALHVLTDGDPVASDVYVIPASPLRDLDVKLGSVLHTRNSFLQHQIDLAIASLIDGGNITEILQLTRTPGVAGER
jgi:polar amino acid transport system substrate-binding protein